MNAKVDSISEAAQPFSFNLITEHWIPVVESETGNVHHVNLHDALVEAHKWSGLAFESPLALVATLRLLLGIIYSACPPHDIRDWEIVWKNHHLPLKKIGDYLSNREGFDLFSPTKPFLQMAELVSSELNVSKLTSEMGTKNNRLLFQWSAADRLSTFTPAEAAVRLMEIQCFGLAGGVSGKVQINEEKIERPNFQDGIIARGVSVWLSGQSLFETLWMNVVPDKSGNTDVPLWEQENLVETLYQKANGSVDRLFWLSRLVKLMPIYDQNSEVVVKSIQFAQGRLSDTDYSSSRDLMGIYHEQEKRKIESVRINEQKASWRDLHAYLAFGSLENPIIRNTARLIGNQILPDDAIYKLNVVGVAANQASIILWRHDVMNLPAEILTSPDQVSNVATAVEYAEATAKQIQQRLKSVVECYLRPGGKADRRATESMVKTLDPQETYWSQLGVLFYQLIEMLPKDSVLALDEWRKAVRREATYASKEAYSRLGITTRALQAIAMGEEKYFAVRGSRYIFAEHDKKAETETEIEGVKE